MDISCHELYCPQSARIATSASWLVNNINWPWFGTASIGTHVILLLLARRSLWAKRLCYRRFAWTICRSSGVSSGHPRRCIVMPFGVVSGLQLGSAVLGFGGDRRRGRGSLGVNKMQKWRVDRLSTRVWKIDSISLRRM